MDPVKSDDAFHLVFERHGGVGDVLFTTPVLRWYRKHGVVQAGGRPLRIVFCTQDRNAFIFNYGSRLVDFLPKGDFFPLQWRLYHKTIDDEEFIRKCLENRARLPFQPDAIISFFEAIERNDRANYINAYDWHLEWAGIDPAIVHEKQKRPIYAVKPREYAAAERIVSRIHGRPRIAVQMHASSLPRTWDKNDRLIRALCMKYPKAAIYSLGDPVAAILEPSPPERCSNYMPLCGVTRNDRRLWAAIINAMDLIITVDSGAMHLAGALGVPIVGLFSTVPGWTRIKYYHRAIAIDSKYPCAPCFRIGMECARSIPTPGTDWMPSLNIRGKNETYPCLSSISVDEVMEAVEKQI